MIYRKVLLCGTGGRVHSLLLNTCTRNKCCHTGWPHSVSHGKHFPFYLYSVTYHIICLLPPLVSGLLKAGDVSYLSCTSSVYHVLVFHRHSVNELPSSSTQEHHCIQFLQIRVSRESSNCMPACSLIIVTHIYLEDGPCLQILSLLLFAPARLVLLL